MKKLFWPTVGLGAVAVSLWLLYDELRWVSLDDVGDGLAAIPPHRWLLSALALSAWRQWSQRKNFIFPVEGGRKHRSAV